MSSGFINKQPLRTDLPTFFISVVTGFQQLQRAKHEPVSHLLNLRDCSKALSKQSISMQDNDPT